MTKKYEDELAARREGRCPARIDDMRVEDVPGTGAAGRVRPRRRGVNGICGSDLGMIHSSGSPSIRIRSRVRAATQILGPRVLRRSLRGGRRCRRRRRRRPGRGAAQLSLRHVCPVPGRARAPVHVGGLPRDKRSGRRVGRAHRRARGERARAARRRLARTGRGGGTAGGRVARRRTVRRRAHRLRPDPRGRAHRHRDRTQPVCGRCGPDPAQ